MCQISIPNKEIAAVYKGEVLSHLLQVGLITQSTANKIAESLYVNDMAKLQTAIMEYMKKTISFYDAGAEGFYHGLLLGLMALLDNQYKIRSNREAGEGRYDIGLIPKEKKYPGIIMELKWARDLSERELQSLSEKALVQIDSKHYADEMRNEGTKELMKLGIAFSGKKVIVT